MTALFTAVSADGPSPSIVLLSPLIGRSLRPREGAWLVQGHKARKAWSQVGALFRAALHPHCLHPLQGPSVIVTRLSQCLLPYTLEVLCTDGICPILFTGE